MAQALLDSPAKIKLVTPSCKEAHTASNLKEPGGVCQLTLGRILNLHKQAGSNDLGRWAWQEFKIDGVCSLYVITTYRVCPKPPPSSKHSPAWHQQYQGLVKKVSAILTLGHASYMITNSSMNSSLRDQSTSSAGMPTPLTMMMRSLISSRILIWLMHLMTS